MATAAPASAHPRRIARILPPRWSLPWLGLTVALLVIAGIQRSPAPNGPLVDIPGNQAGAMVPLDAPFTFSGVDLINAGRDPLVIEHIALGPHTANVRMVRARVPIRGSGSYGLAMIDPRLPRRRASFRAPGFALSGGPESYADRNAARLDVVLRATAPGLVVVRGIVIAYRVGDRHYTERVGPILGACAPAPGHAGCRIPGFIPW